MIRSTPSSSGSGNITPASTTMVVSAHEIASMFMPNSPSPPSATISSIGEAGGTHLRPVHSWRKRPGRREPRCGSLRLLGAPETREAGCRVGRGLVRHGLRTTYGETIAQLISQQHIHRRVAQIQRASRFPVCAARRGRLLRGPDQTTVVLLYRRRGARSRESCGGV